MSDDKLYLKQILVLRSKNTKNTKTKILKERRAGAEGVLISRFVWTNYLTLQASPASLELIHNFKIYTIVLKKRRKNLSR